MDRFQFDYDAVRGMTLTEGLLVLLGQLENHYNTAILGRMPPEPPNTAQVRALLQNLIEIINPREKPLQARQNALRARLRDYTEAEIIQAAYAFADSSWHREHNQMSIDNFLAPSKFGRWYAASLKPQVAEAKSIKEEQEELARFRNGD